MLTKLTHEAVNYGVGMPHSHCSICVHYIEPSRTDPKPHCHIVRDPIRAKDWCDRFEHLPPEAA